MGSMEGLSKFERERMADERHLQEVSEHAFAADERDWGWFDPQEWFDFVQMMKPFSEGATE